MTHGDFGRTHFSPDFADNPLEFRYVLVVGRWPMKRYTATQAARVTQLAEREGIELLTYDPILRGSHELRIGQPKNVLSHSRDTYRIKRACAATSLFASYRHDQIDVPPDAIAWFKARGYDMNAWQSGELLAVNDRSPWQAGDGLITEWSGEKSTDER